MGPGWSSGCPLPTFVGRATVPRRQGSSSGEFRAPEDGADLWHGGGARRGSLALRRNPCLVSQPWRFHFRPMRRGEMCGRLPTR